jgi:hypothetical protein
MLSFAYTGSHNPLMHRFNDYTRIRSSGVAGVQELQEGGTVEYWNMQ